MCVRDAPVSSVRQNERGLQREMHAKKSTSPQTVLINILKANIRRIGMLLFGEHQSRTVADTFATGSSFTLDSRAAVANAADLNALRSSS
ncbi:hypothetical protein MTO96_011568 [Rhipicephalus appendiculatus]